MGPAAGAPAPASRIGTAGRLVDLGSLLANGLGCSTVKLMGRDEPDAAVPVLVVDQSTNAATHWNGSSTLANGRLGKSGRNFAVQNSDSEYEL